MPTATLYELSQEMRSIASILETIDAHEGELTPEIQDAVNEVLQRQEDTKAALEDKIDGYCKFIRHLEVSAKMRREEAERLNRLAVSDERKIDFLKARLQEHLAATDTRKLRTKHFNVSICRNGGKQPMAIAPDADPRDVADRFVKVRRDFDKEKIRKALDGGEELEFAYLADRKEHLRIR